MGENCLCACLCCLVYERTSLSDRKFKKMCVCVSVSVSVGARANLSVPSRPAVSSSVLAEVERWKADCLGSAIVLLLFI